MKINNIENIGIDFIDKKRIDLENKGFIQRFLTSNEFDIFNKITNNEMRINFIASRWTSKEAIYKAINNDRLLIKNIEILNESNGKPFCNSHDNIVLSTTHSNNYTISIAIKLK